MKKLVQVILLIILFPCLASAQISTTTCPGAGCIDFNVGGNGSVGIQITGTWSGTITFQASVNNTTFTAINVIPATSPTAVSTTTGNGLWSASIGGLSTVRAVFTSYVSGSANVAFRTAQAKAGSGGTGGGGSVTSIATTSPVTGGTITTTGTIACPTCGVTGTGLNQFASTTSAQLAGVLSDKTGTGLVVFQTSPTIITPTIADFTSSTHGHVDAASGGGLSGTYCALAGCTMVGNIVMPNNGNIQSTSGNMNFGSPAALFVQGTTTNTFGSGTGLTLLNTNACGGGSCVTGNINILTGNATGGTATAGSITMDAGTTTLTKGYNWWKCFKSYSSRNGYCWNSYSSSKRRCK